MIKLENITFKYEKTILDSINLTINKNKITCIIGVNGSGKTTLASIISGLLFSQSGHIFLDDIEINKKTDSKLIRKKIGMVFQNPNNQILFSRVSDDIKFTLENLKYPKNEIPTIIKKSLEKVNMLNFINSNPYKLSGGEKQRIAIASQLSYNPDYIIFDEATSMLDINSKKDIYKLFKTLKKDIGVIYITNDISEIIHADDIIILDNTKAYKYTLSNIIKNNNILTKHKLNIPFVLKLLNKLNIKDIKNINEEYILERISKND